MPSSVAENLALGLAAQERAALEKKIHDDEYANYRETSRLRDKIADLENTLIWIQTNKKRHAEGKCIWCGKPLDGSFMCTFPQGRGGIFCPLKEIANKQIEKNQ